MELEEFLDKALRAIKDSSDKANVKCEGNLTVGLTVEGEKIEINEAVADPPLKLTVSIKPF